MSLMLLCSCAHSSVEQTLDGTAETSRQQGGGEVGTRPGVTNVRFVAHLPSPPLLLLLNVPCSSLLGGRFTLAPERIFLCGEVRVLLVPFAWGQALFSVEVLRVYPNVQDLGVSARLSES